MNELKAKPGRPKTLDPTHVINVATLAYWEHGPTDVPISEICDIAGTSKPALYREFGNDDGLRVAVLEQYRSTVLEALFTTLSQNKPFMAIVEDVLDMIVPLDANDEVPQGCLVIAMRGRRGRLGEKTITKLDQLQNEQVEVYRQWILTCQANGSVRAELSPEVTASYCNLQFTGAMQLHREGISNAEIAQGLRTAFGTLAVLQ